MENFLTGSSNGDYHADKSHLSSSSLKLLLKEPERFYEEHILGIKKPQEQNNNFDEGTLVHTMLLEPEKLDESIAIFPGLRKAGGAYEEFKAANEGKLIFSAAQYMRCQKLSESAKNHKVAMELLSNGKPEHTMLSKILDVPVKMRADYIVEGSYIVDVKTTSAPTGSDMFRATIAQYSYELSAALYAQIAYDNLKSLHEFYWIVLSKNDGKCSVYKASSDTLAAGAAQVTQAVVKYKQCIDTNLWTTDSFSDNLSEEVEII